VDFGGIEAVKYMRWALAWMFFWIGDAVSRLDRWDIGWLIALWFPVYQYCMRWSHEVQVGEFGPWKLPDHKLSFKNRESLESSGRWSCFFCFHEGRYSEITDWIDSAQTALCPHCGVDALLPGLMAHETLVAMCEKWFTNAAWDGYLRSWDDFCKEIRGGK
jgi:hypothetical protein